MNYKLIIFFVVSKCDFKGIQCQFWDLGGGLELRRLWPKYFPESHVVFFVIDGSDLTRLDEVGAVIEGIEGDEGCGGLPVAVLINKCDLFVEDEEEEEERAVIKVKETFNPLFSSIEARESKVFTVSALSG